MYYFLPLTSLHKELKISLSCSCCHEFSYGWWPCFDFLSGISMCMQNRWKNQNDVENEEKWERMRKDKTTKVQNRSTYTFTIAVAVSKRQNCAKRLFALCISTSLKPISFYFPLRRVCVWVRGKRAKTSGPIPTSNAEEESSWKQMS